MRLVPAWRLRLQPGPGVPPRYRQGQPGPGVPPRYGQGQPGPGEQPRYRQGQPGPGEQPRYRQDQPGPGEQPRYRQDQPGPGEQPRYGQDQPGPGVPPRYRQGQRPGPRTREYFYYIDHHGQLFLDDTKVKNFITCFKDEAFLAFFFTRLEANRSGRYESHFPFLSRCGGERNFLRCEDRPVVFTHLFRHPDGTSSLSYCGGGRGLLFPFQPGSLTVLPENGRLYHPAPAKPGGVGLIRSALALEWTSCFLYEDGEGRPPTHFLWEERPHRLTGELLPVLRGGRHGEGAPVTPGSGVV